MAKDSPAPQVSTTEFEKGRGISRVEVRSGYAQVHISDLVEPLTQSRLSVLENAATAGISLDFLKFTPDGMSFLVREEDAAPLVEALTKGEAKLSSAQINAKQGRDVVMVHAVNMRDEEGLIASIVLQAIRSGAEIGHVSDMHDRVLIVVAKEDSSRLKDQLEGNLIKVRA